MYECWTRSYSVLQATIYLMLLKEIRNVKVIRRFYDYSVSAKAYQEILTGKKITKLKYFYGLYD